MKHFLLVLLLGFSSLCAAQEPTTVYLIRHAEKDLNTKQDPALTRLGHYRATKWAEVFSEISLDAVYSTNTKRTLDTAKPSASKNNKRVSDYHPKEFDYPAFVKKHRGQSVLIVGHSNTTPAFVNALINEEKYSELDESNYGSLFIVTIIEGKASSTLLSINPTLAIENEDP